MISSICMEYVVSKLFEEVNFSEEMNNGIVYDFMYFVIFYGNNSVG